MCTVCVEYEEKSPCYGSASQPVLLGIRVNLILEGWPRQNAGFRKISKEILNILGIKISEFNSHMVRKIFPIFNLHSCTLQSFLVCIIIQISLNFKCSFCLLQSNHVLSKE